MLMAESLWEQRLNSGRQRTHLICEYVLIQTQTLSLCDLWGKIIHALPDPSRVAVGGKNDNQASLTEEAKVAVLLLLKKRDVCVWTS